MKMTNLFKLIFIFCFIAFNLYSQQWVKINPVFEPPGNYNTYIGFFADENHAWWNVGYLGSLWYSTDKGLTWIQQTDSSDLAVYDIKFIDNLHGWMTGRILPGSTYNIMITKDGGLNWNRYVIPTILCTTFFDSLNGFAGGEDSVFLTTDGGINWKPQAVDINYGFGITDIFFVDRKLGWAAGGRSDVFDAGFILNSIDSGKTWQFNDTLTITGKAVYFTDYLHGYIVGSNPPFFEGAILVTSNGGNNWLTHYLPGSWLNDVIFTDDSTGWAVGDYGFIWKTTDRGINWIHVESGTNSDLHNIFFFNEEKTGYILGEDSTLLKYDSTVGVDGNTEQSDLSFELFQNYPNPFNPMTILSFVISHWSFVSLKIYDLRGKEVRILVNEEKKPGSYTVVWDGKDNYGNEVSSGVYFYQLKSDSFSKVRKLIFVK